MRKRGGLLQETIVQVILIGIILVLFLFATAGKINGRGVKQQVLEKEIALLIDSAEAGMSFEIDKINLNGVVDDIRIESGKVFVSVDGLPSMEGYPYFSKYLVSVEELESKFIIFVK